MLHCSHQPEQQGDDRSAVQHPQERFVFFKPFVHDHLPSLESTVKLVDVYKDRERAMRFLFELLVEREPGANISHVATPSWQKHRQFVCRKPYRYWYMVDVEGKGLVGAVYATDRNEIGIAIKREHRGNGYGPEAVLALVRMHKPLPAIPSVRAGRWLANINPANAHSIAMFSGMGFKHIQNTYALG